MINVDSLNHEYEKNNKSGCISRYIGNVFFIDLRDVINNDVTPKYGAAAILVHCNAQRYSCIVRLSSSHHKFRRYTTFYLEDKGNEVSELGKTYLG